ncbi:MAG: S1C family serine protease [Catonella sp.]|uniref:S1C family serine protease n=1 Tax=Catonella sp. TaxID=2382125 RepID=UPI003FA100BD
MDNYNGFNENENNQETNSGYYGNYPLNDGNLNNSQPSENVSKRKKNKSNSLAFVLAAALLIGGSAGGGVYLGNMLSVRQETGNQVLNKTEIAVEKETKNTVTLATTADSKGVTATTSDVSGVVENVMPSIVSINNVYDTVTTDIFGQSYKNQTGGSGSGIIIGQNDAEVLIVSNNHVTAANSNAKNQKITVTFNDETTAEATIKGADSGSDLSVLSVKMSDIKKDTLSKIKVATVGDSSKMKVGQMVIAIGNALGYGQSTTVGYVSALNREIADEDFTMKLIQTDAAINPGNSGGALLNAKGEVIGINSVKYADEKVEGMGFSIPISTALPIINDLMNREEIAENEQSYLGIMGRDVTKNYNQIYGIPIGVYITDTTKNSPADKAGLKMGNIITEFNGITVKTMTELQAKLATVKAGTAVKLTIMQYDNGQYVKKEVQVVLGNRSELKDGSDNSKNNYKNEENNVSEEDNRIPFGGREGNSEESPFGFFFNR